MLKLAAAVLALATPAMVQATTLTVENRSGRQVSLTITKAPVDYDVLDPTLRPGATFAAFKPGGKVLMPHDDADRATFEITYVDQRGAGCRFGVMPIRHSTTWTKIKPMAAPIGDGRCEARTGSTIGDFVFVVR